MLGHGTAIDEITVVGVRWNPFDAVGKATQENLLTNTYVEALRQLAPDMGAYINEVWPLANVDFEVVPFFCKIGRAHV